ncbi:MAG TPA: hypothetical protein PJ982_14365, partial [Lacipirellulaceae bacterium]|nr:hypothetical protein [Lacipirellulaceae bacterium]
MLKSIKRSLAVACGGVLAVALQAPAAPAQAPGVGQPMAVIAITSYDQLMQDVDFLGEVLGMPGASAMVEQTLLNVTQNKGLAGLDKSRPLGVVVQTAGMMPTPTILLPVTDQAAFLDLASMFGAMSQDFGEGITQVSVMGQDAYARSAGGWMTAALAPALLDAAPADPGAALGALTAEYDVAIQFNVQNIPDMWRQQALTMMTAAANRGMNKRPDESDADFAARQQALQAELAANQRMIQEVDQVTLGLSIDSSARRALLDIIYTAMLGTALAEEVAANSGL